MNKLFGIYSGRRDCGRVRRERTASGRSCDQCVVGGRGLTSQRVGNGASIVHRQLVDEDFRRERHVAARQALKKSEKTLRAKGHNHVEVISSKNSVWCPEYYHHPKTVAETNYGRKGARAPPVAPPRADRSPKESHGKDYNKPVLHQAPSAKTSRKPPGNKPREGYLTKGWEKISSQHAAPGVLSVAAERKPAFEPSGSRHSRPRSPTGLTPVPRSHGPTSAPNRPAQGYPTNIGYAETCDYKHALPMAGQGQASAQPSACHEAPRATAQLKPRPQAKAQAKAQPKPLYLVYLEEQNQARWQAPLQPRTTTTSHTSSAPTKREPKRTVLRSLGMAIGIDPPSPSGTTSDLSFACGAAREIERQVPRQE